MNDKRHSKCSSQAPRQRYDNRESASRRGYDAAWVKVRDRKLARDPLCERCGTPGRAVLADTVHHIQPVETHPGLRLVDSNLQSLCRDCHEIIHGRVQVKGCGVDGTPADPGHWWHR